MFALEKKAIQLFRDYSTGTRKKFALARALIHQPRILLLDEITNSLDLHSAQSVKSLVREYISNQHDCCAVWSTHRFEEIDEICDQVLVLKEGRAKFFGATVDLRARYDSEAVHHRDGKCMEDTTHGMNNIYADST